MAYEPTHVAPPGGLPAWLEPDPSQEPAATLDPGLDVQVLERRGEWAHIECSNGWKAWVDARHLVEQPSAAGAAESATPDATADVAASEPEQPAQPATAWTATTQPTATAAPVFSPAVTAPRRKGAFGLGAILALVGGVIVGLSSLLAWIDFGEGRNAWDTPAEFLIDNQNPFADAFPLGALVVIAAAVIVIGALLRPLRLLIVIGAIAALALAVVHFVQSALLASDLEPLFEFTDITGPAPFVTIVGGFVALAGGIVALLSRRQA